jgi:4-hydroxy-4-methyl-2-oxoglutarate aldolase
MSDIKELKQRLTDVDTTAICDADKTTRVMGSAIACRSSNRFVCGPAFTIRCRDDFFGVARAVESASPGDVLVVDGGAAKIALAGELFARAALARSLGGIFVDGGYRDIGYISSCDLPVYSRYVMPMAGTASKLGELQVPVTCGGVTVLPGDIVVADIEGVVVLDPNRALDVLDAALQIKLNEARVIHRLSDGATLSDCLNVKDHSASLTKGEYSSLRFTV